MNPNSEQERIENSFPINTFRAETKRQLVEFVLTELADARDDENNACQNIIKSKWGTNDQLWDMQDRMNSRHQTNKPKEDSDGKN